MSLLPQDNSAKVIMDLAVMMETRVDNGSVGQPVYTGYAEPGTNTGSTGWMIKKTLFDGSGLPAGTTCANGDAVFNKVWAWRAGSYTYGS